MWVNWLWRKEEEEEEAEGLKLVSLDVTWLGQYVVFVVKGEVCNLSKRWQEKKCHYYFTETVWCSLFYFHFSFIDVTHKLFKPNAVFCNAYIFPETMGHISIAQLMILQESK